MPSRVSVPCLVGPTASGKTGVGLDLARRANGEVICCDAFTVYRHMPILTAAPEPPPDVPHHLLGHVDPSEAYNAARFLEDADRLVASIRERGHTPWIVGGTALYLRAWVHGFGAPVPRDEGFRDRMRAKVEAEGAAALHAELQIIDPTRAAELHPNDVRRVVRALEIARATNLPPSDQRGEWTAPPRVEAQIVCLRRDVEDLDARIEARTRQMFDAGVVDEARALLERTLSPEAGKALGLAELAALLGGEIDQAEAIERIARRTRRLARKQMTFFRSFPAVHFVDVEPDATDADVAALVSAALDDPPDQDV